MKAGISRRLKLYISLARKCPGRVAVRDCIRYFLPWAASLKAGRGTIADQQIWVVFRASAFLDRILRTGLRVFEYGAGGSTLYFLKHGCHLVSVEHDPQWFKAVSDEIGRRRYADWKGLLREPDPEPHQDSANQIPGSYRSQFGAYTERTFRDYATTIEEFADGTFDLVLVDGRARVSCVHHSREKVKPGGWLVLDNSERDRYAQAFQMLNPESWQKRDFFGPGPYVQHEFWGTTVWKRLEPKTPIRDERGRTDGLPRRAPESAKCLPTS